MAFILWFGGSGLRAGSLTGAFSPVAKNSSVDLTMIGKLDWVHWGLYTYTSVNRKNCVSPMISDLGLVGDPSCTNCFLADYQYADNANGYTWHDGSPVSTVTNTTTGVWAYQSDATGSYPLGSGFQITVPADTMQRTLQVFVGAYAGAGQLRASLSDGSAPSFISQTDATVNNQNNGPGGVFTLNYSANSSSQMLTIQWTLVQQNSSDANVTIQAAALTAPGANNPPYVAINNPTNYSTFPQPATITMTAIAQDFDGSVSSVAYYAGASLLGRTTNSPYSLTWSNVPSGHYTLTAFATDNSNSVSCAQQVEIFVYGSGGVLSNAVMSPPPAAADLTSMGTADWIHWGLVSKTSVDRKYLGQVSVAAITAPNPNALQQYSDNYTAFSWSDGTPTLTSTGTTTGVFITGVTNAFRFSAPADTYPRQLNVYVGGYGVQGRLLAYLADLSAPPYLDSSVSNLYDNSYAVYTINYRAASPGQQLIVVYNSLTLFDLLYGNVTLQSLALSGGPQVQPVRLFNPVCTGNNFIFSFLTQSNLSYAIQSANSLNTANWATLTNLAGTGTSLTVTNPAVNAPQTYYRVQIRTRSN